MVDTITEALNYFDSPVYARLFPLFKKKYESLGRVSGSVSIESFSDEETAELASFFGMQNYKLKDKKKIPLADFEKQLQNTRFEGLHLKALLEAYFEEELVSKKEQKETKHYQLNALLDDLIKNNPAISEWLHYLKLKSPDTYWIYALIEQSDEAFEKMVKTLENAILLLPENPVRLPVYAQKLTGNPHSLDRNTALGKLFYHLLTFKAGNTSQTASQNVSTTETINELLLTFNILRDDITNYITLANIVAETTNDKELMWQAAAKTHSVMNVPMRELLDVTRLYTLDGLSTVWIVENSGVFSSILDEIPEAPLMCTHGQFKLAAWQTLDKLEAENYTLYYASDIDPEGLGMADRLYARYPQHVNLWKMDVEAYEKAVVKEDQLSSARLNKLTNLSVEELNPVKTKMMQLKYPAYQEALLGEMVEDIKSILNQQNI